MGLLPIMLHRTPRVGGALTMGFLVSKLVLRCVQIGPRPIRLLEKIGVFVLDRKNAKLGLAYFAVRMAVSKQRTSGRVEKALGYTGLSDEELGEQGIPPQEVAVVLRMLEELDDMRSYAGYKFVEFLLGKRAVDSKVSGRYSLPKGRFNLQQCLGEYFSSPRMQDFHDVIAKGCQEGGPGLDKEAVAHQGERVWGEIQVRMRDDLIDFLVL